MSNFNTPPEIGLQMCNVSEAKGTAELPNLIVLGVLAGSYIALAGNLAAIVTSDISRFLGAGLSRFLSGSVFAMGLILVVLGGGELFTGNVLMVMGLLSKRITSAQLLRNWIVVYLANFAGSLVVVGLLTMTGLWKLDNGVIGAKLALTALSKVNLTFLEAFSRGVLANWLVCLAVWLAMSSHDVAGKILAIYFPVTAFVACGFEHSIANQFAIPIGLTLSKEPLLQQTLATVDLTNLTWESFLLKNLVPVTLGNIIGGAVFVGLLYWYVYLSPRR